MTLEKTYLLTINKIQKSDKKNSSVTTGVQFIFEQIYFRLKLKPTITAPTDSLPAIGRSS